MLLAHKSLEFHNTDMSFPETHRVTYELPTGLIITNSPPHHVVGPDAIRATGTYPPVSPEIKKFARLSNAERNGRKFGKDTSEELDRLGDLLATTLDMKLSDLRYLISSTAGLRAATIEKDKIQKT